MNKGLLSIKAFSYLLLLLIFALIMLSTTFSESYMDLYNIPNLFA